MEIGIGFTSGSRKNIKMTIEILGSDYETRPARVARTKVRMKRRKSERGNDRKTYDIRTASILAYPHQISSHIPSPKPHSLGVKTLPNHAAQLCTAPHHRIQPRVDGGVEEVDAEGVHVRARMNARGAGRAVSPFECVFGLEACLL
jgi:hypothetical protein